MNLNAKPESSLPGWPARRATLGAAAEARGTGLHTGKRVRARLLPAGAGQGIVFRRIRDGETLADIPARHAFWHKQPLCSSLKSKDGTIIRTIEHVLAALLMSGIDDAVVEVHGEELPHLDGGAVEWLRLLREIGRADHPQPKRFIRVLKPYAYQFGQISRYEIVPADSYLVDVTTKVEGVGPMRWKGLLTPDVFVTEIAPARSYGLLKWALPALIGSYLTGVPLIRGARLSTVAAIWRKQVVGGMTVPDEFVRHRVLDLVGDFALAGAPILGKTTVDQPSHRRNQKFMRTFLQRKDGWEWCAAEPA